jgi:hypothetical protein
MHDWRCSNERAEEVAGQGYTHTYVCTCTNTQAHIRPYADTLQAHTTHTRSRSPNPPEIFFHVIVALVILTAFSTINLMLMPHLLGDNCIRHLHNCTATRGGS